MKPIKMFGLAMLAALMGMAVAGVPAAMGEGPTSLCSKDPGAGPEEQCPEGSLVTHVHETSVSKAKLLTTFLTIECDVLFLGDALASLGNPLVIHGTFTYTNCGSCKVTEESGPSEIKVLRLGHESGDVTGEGLVHAVCGTSLDCSYNGVELVGSAKGPLLATQANGEVSLLKKTTSKEAGGFLCPSSSKLDITTTPLSATYVTGTRSTSLCSKDPGAGPEEQCPEGSLVTHVHETSVTKAKLLTTFLTIECDVLFLGDALASLGNPLVIHGTFTYTNCGSCKVTEESGPSEIKVLRLGHESGDVTGEGLVHAVCGTSLDCSYNGVELVGTAKGPLLATRANGEVVLANQTTSKEAGGFLCPSSSKLDITTTPLSATYVTK